VDFPITEVAGLQLSNNTFSASPPGSLSKATNGVISQKGVFQPRNGQAWASTMPVAADLPFSIVEFQLAMLVNYATSKTGSYALGRVSSGSISAYSGTYNPVGANGSATDYARMHFCLAALYLHWCTAAGPYTLEAYNGTPRRSGLSPVPDFTGTLTQPNLVGASAGVIPYNSSVAYRYTHKRITSSTQVLTSPPSNRFITTNRFLVPAGSLVHTGAGGAELNTATFSTLWNSLVLPFDNKTFTLSPGEANFPAGSYTTGPLAPGSNAPAWVNAAANGVSTLAQDMNPGPLVAVLTITLSADCVAGDIIQLFKSVATSSSSIEPSQDVYLCNEHKVTSGEIATGHITITDTTPESTLRVPLYTNASDGDGQGELGAKFPPPIYGDVANFDARTFYLNTVGQQYMDMQMLGVGAPNGIQNNDTLTIFDGVSTTKTYTFKTSPSGAGEVRIISDGTPSYNIAWTSYFLGLAVTADFLSLGMMMAVSTSPNGFPGGIRLQRVDYSSTAFQVKASRPETWMPMLAAATYTNSFVVTQPNGLTWSNIGEPEAVPVINSLFVGVSNYFGRRIFGLRNALIILKEGDGIWALTGSGGVYSLQQISTANIIAPDCACVFADHVWAYTDQGVLRISDTGGVDQVDRPIRTVLNGLAATLPTETYAYSYAVGYETEQRVMFFFPFEAATTARGGVPLMKAFAYSTATNSWTGPLEFNETPVSGVVSTGHQLWLGAYDSVFSQGRVTEERKTDSYLDVAEASWSNTLATTADPYTISLATAGAIQIGTGISQVIGGLTYRTKVSAVLGGGLYEVEELISWANGACTIYDPFEVEVQFLPEGSPGSRKMLSRLATLYKPESFSNFFGLTTLETDQMQAELEIDTPFEGFGLTPFGTGPFGNPAPMVVDANPVSAAWVNAGQFFPGFKLDEVWCQMRLQGLGMQIEGASGPVGRGK
jgi:hypothetical protein